MTFSQLINLLHKKYNNSYWHNGFCWWTISDLEEDKSDFENAKIEVDYNGNIDINGRRMFIRYNARQYKKYLKEEM